MLPGSIAHRDLCVPLRLDADGLLVVAVPDPEESELREKLRFVLNRPVRTVGANAAELKFAIWRSYGPPNEEG